jgi:DNA-binding beta-propeller fold protein YncE
LVSALVFVSVLLAQPATAASPYGEVRNFGPDLKTTCAFPEGIAVDPQGRIYASSANLPASSGPSTICVLDASSGSIVDVISVSPGLGGVAKLLGMLFVPGEGLYVADLGSGGGDGRVLRVNVRTHAVAVVATGFGAPNAFARDEDGNLWVSDSFAGSITKISHSGVTRTFAYTAELKPAQGEQPPFGANGLAFDRSEQYLYVAMTARDQILRIRYEDGALGRIEVFATGTPQGALDGADGIAFDVKGNLFVCSNQSNEVAVLSPSGSVIAEIRGVGGNRFSNPASPVFRGRQVFIANLAAFEGVDGMSKVSVFTAPFPGAPLITDDNGDGNDEQD